MDPCSVRYYKNNEMSAILVNKFIFFASRSTNVWAPIRLPMPSLIVRDTYHRLCASWIKRAYSFRCAKRKEDDVNLGKHERLHQKFPYLRQTQRPVGACHYITLQAQLVPKRHLQSPHD